MTAASGVGAGTAGCPLLLGCCPSGQEISPIMVAGFLVDLMVSGMFRAFTEAITWAQAALLRRPARQLHTWAMRRRRPGPRWR